MGKPIRFKSLRILIWSSSREYIYSIRQQFNSFRVTDLSNPGPDDVPQANMNAVRR